MIYTVTINPSLDYIVDVKNFSLGLTNRTEAEQILPGGKGINVSILLKNLGIESTALGFVAGFTGEELITRLENMKIRQEFIRISGGMTRINVKLRTTEGTEINGMGPNITEREISKLLFKLDQCDRKDIVVLAGSIPRTVSDDLYKKIAFRLSKKKVTVVIDATKELLTEVLPYHPFLIKPNHHEVGEIFGVSLNTRQEVIPYGKKLQEMGARNVLISMAGNGSVFIAEDGTVIEADAPKGKLINGVGAGDSMVAGFLAGWLEKQDYQYAYQLAAAAGSASAFSKNLATKEEIMKLYHDTLGN